MKLTKQQQKTFNNFNKYNDIVVFAPRRSGKTQLINYIIEQNADKNIGIVTSSSDMFGKIRTSRNCEHISLDNKHKGKKFDIIIGEEYIISKGFNADKKISFLTPPFIVDMWSRDECEWFSKEDLQRAADILPKEILKSQYFID